MVKLILKYTARDLTQEFLWAAFFFIKRSKKKVWIFLDVEQEKMCAGAFFKLFQFIVMYTNSQDENQHN